MCFVADNSKHLDYFVEKKREVSPKNFYFL